MTHTKKRTVQTLSQVSDDDYSDLEQKQKKKNKSKGREKSMNKKKTQKKASDNLDKIITQTLKMMGMSHFNQEVECSTAFVVGHVMMKTHGGTNM